MNLAGEYTVATQVVWPRPKHTDGFDEFLQFTYYDQFGICASWCHLEPPTLKSSQNKKDLNDITHF